MGKIDAPRTLAQKSEAFALLGSGGLFLCGSRSVCLGSGLLGGGGGIRAPASFFAKRSSILACLGFLTGHTAGARERTAPATRDTVPAPDTGQTRPRRPRGSPP